MYISYTHTHLCQRDTYRVVILIDPFDGGWRVWVRVGFGQETRAQMVFIAHHLLHLERTL